MQQSYWGATLLAWLVSSGLVPESTNSLDEVQMLKVYKKFARQTKQQDLATFLAEHYPSLGCIITDPLHFYSLLVHFCHVNNYPMKTRPGAAKVLMRLQQRVNIFCQLLPQLGAAVDGQALTRAIDLINRRQGNTVSNRSSSSSETSVSQHFTNNNNNSDELVCRMAELLVESKARLQALNTISKHYPKDETAKRLLQLKNPNHTKPGTHAAVEQIELPSRKEVEQLIDRLAEIKRDLQQPDAVAQSACVSEDSQYTDTQSLTSCALSDRSEWYYQRLKYALKGIMTQLKTGGNELRDAKQKQQRSDEQLTVLIDELEHCLSRLQELRENYEHAEARQRQMQEQLETTKRWKAKMREERAALERQVEEQERCMQQALSEKQLLHSAYNELLQAHEKLQEQQKHMETERLQWEEKLGASENAQRKTEERLRYAKETLRTTERTLLDKQDKITAQLSELEQELQGSKAHATQLQVKLEQLQTELHSSKEHGTQLQTAMEQEQKQLQKEQQRVKMLMEQLFQERSEKQTLKTKCRRLEMELQRSECARDSDKCAAHAKLKQLSEDLEGIVSEFVDLREHNGMLNEGMMLLKAENKQLHEEGQVQQQHVLGIQAHLHQLVQQLGVLCREREVQFSEKNKQIEELNERNAQLQIERQQLQEGVTRVASMQQTLAQEVSTHMQQMADTITAGQALEEHCHRLQTAYDEAQRQLADAQHNLGYTVTKIDEVLKSNRVLQQMLHDVNATVEDADEKANAMAMCLKNAKQKLSAAQQLEVKTVSPSPEQPKTEPMDQPTNEPTPDDGTLLNNTTNDLQAIENRSRDLENYCENLKAQLLADGAKEIEMQGELNRNNAALESTRQRHNQLLEHLNNVLKMTGDATQSSTDASSSSADTSEAEEAETDEEDSDSEEDQATTRTHTTAETEHETEDCMAFSKMPPRIVEKTEQHKLAETLKPEAEIMEMSSIEVPRPASA